MMNDSGQNMSDVDKEGESSEESNGEIGKEIAKEVEGEFGSSEQYKKLIYRSWHRGCKETDILLGDFAKAELRTFNSLEVEEYELFLEEEDSLIYKWLTNQVEAPAKYLNLTRRVKKYFSNPRDSR